MARIITVYISSPRESDSDAAAWVPSDMSYIRWFKISEALAQHGHQVDMAIPDGTLNWPVDPALLLEGMVGFRELSSVKWHEYDVVKTLFNRGIETLESYGGIDHPFIISKLGSVVGPKDLPGIHFYGQTRAGLYAAQEKISTHSKYVTVLSEAAKELWVKCHGEHNRLLLVPGGVDSRIPDKHVDPYPDNAHGRCLFAGHIYTNDSQPEANATLCAKLNELGSLLQHQDIQLYMIGSGDISALNDKYVNFLGVVPYTESWNYLQHADVGIIVSAGKFMHNNESSKIYHYLRAGLPVVTESGFPNGDIVEKAGLGFVVSSGDMPLMARQIGLASGNTWKSKKAEQFILDRHTWYHRAGLYEDVFTRKKILQISPY
jgi:hypothetical protein